MLTFSMLFNSMIASGTIGVLIYTVYSIVKKQVPSVPMLIAFGFVLYELIATQYLLPHIGSSATAGHGYFSRDAIIEGVPFFIGILLIVYSLFVTVALGKKATICSHLTFTESLVAIAILIVLSHPIVGTATTGVAIVVVLLFGATVVGYLINVALSLILYFYKNASRRHSVACGDEEGCLSSFPLQPLVNISSIGVIGRSFVFGAATLMPIAFWTLHCESIALNILIGMAIFASLVVLTKNDKEDGAPFIASLIGIVLLAFGLLFFLIAITSDASIDADKMLVLYSMIATGFLLIVAGAPKFELSCNTPPKNVRRPSTTVASIKSEYNTEVETKHYSRKKKYPIGR